MIHRKVFKVNRKVFICMHITYLLGLHGVAESDMTEGFSLTHNISSKHIKEKFIATVKNRQIDLVVKDFKTISSSKYF